MDRASLGELMLDVVLAEEEGVLLFPPQLLCPCFTLYISLYICIVFLLISITIAVLDCSDCEVRRVLML